MLLLAGLAVAIAGIVAYVVQLRLQVLKAPWYMPVLSTAGLLLVIASLWRARSVWRYLALAFVFLLAAGEWALIVVPDLPAYTGSVAEGKPFPAFATMRADGSSFTQRDLGGDTNDVLVFFRGRW
jgi:hypothetical protein